MTSKAQKMATIKRKYTVTLDITIMYSHYPIVEAESEDEALDKAWAAYEAGEYDSVIKRGLKIQSQDRGYWAPMVEDLYPL